MATVADAIAEGTLKELGIKKPKVVDHWGRLGTEWYIGRQPFEQWVGTAIYYDSFDHKIDFKKPYEPEFAIFLDLPHKYWADIREIKGFERAKQTLEKAGYEFNFGRPKILNGWRFCYWREPVGDHLGRDISEIIAMFDERLKTLLKSDLWKLLDR
jgi:hypothetical protein